MIPRVVIAGTSSGAGKTTVATGLIAALAREPSSRSTSARHGTMPLGTATA